MEKPMTGGHDRNRVPEEDRDFGRLQAYRDSSGVIYWIDVRHVGEREPLDRTGKSPQNPHTQTKRARYIAARFP